MRHLTIAKPEPYRRQTLHVCQVDPECLSSAFQDVSGDVPLRCLECTAAPQVKRKPRVQYLSATRTASRRSLPVWLTWSQLTWSQLVSTIHSQALAIWLWMPLRPQYSFLPALFLAARLAKLLPWSLDPLPTDYLPAHYQVCSQVHFPAS